MGKFAEELVTPDEFLSLKNRIRNEVKRRKYVGDVSMYGSPSYDYTISPKADETIILEHINKISEIVGVVDDTNIKKTSVDGDLITELVILDSEITRFESANVSTGASGCKSSCTGFCSSSCTGTCGTTCTGCTGCSSCSGTCSGSCSGCSGCSSSCGVGCGSSCGSSCGNWCDQTCSSYCSGACDFGCSSSCETNCAHYCGSGCSQNCSGSCQISCSTGCGGGSK